MPNGGSDYCMRCIYNSLNRGIEDGCEIFFSGCISDEMMKPYNSRCTIRNISIWDPFVTVCQNFLTGSSRPDGLVYSRGFLGNDYARIPWHNNHSPENAEGEQCAVCRKVFLKGIRILHGKDTYESFCSHRHYLEWWKSRNRDKQLDLDLTAFKIDTDNYTQVPELVFAVRRLDLESEFNKAFGGDPHVKVVYADIVSVPDIDSVISPANAFGRMDGGVDQVYVYTFGQQIENKVIQTIEERYTNGMPVGDAFIVPTGHERIRYLIVAPTMRTPGYIRGTDNVYRAFRAALTEALVFNARSEEKIGRIGSPSLGTGTGGVPAGPAVEQMLKAYQEVFANQRRP